MPFRQVHPLATVRIRNDDTRSLPAGVLTLYDQTGGTSFAGDARLGGLPAGETRLLSFAQDLRTTVDTKLSSQPNTFIAFSVANGVLTYTMRTRQLIRVDIAAPAKEPRDLLLEIPRSNADQTLTLEDAKLRVTETNRGRIPYRPFARGGGKAHDYRLARPTDAANCRTGER